MPWAWPPLTWQEIAACLKALGFEHDRDESSHQIWVHPKRQLSVPVDKHWNPCSRPMLKHLVTVQARVTREAFYGATKATRKKI